MNKCSICGCDLGAVPLCFGSSSPARLMVPEGEYESRVVENEDQCIVDNEYYFVRGHIELPIQDSDEQFIWSVWVSLSAKSFEHMSENWEIDGRERHAPYFGWLMTNLPCYPKTQHLKTSVQSNPVGVVPSITIDQTEHPLSTEQQEGVSMERIHQIVHVIMQHDSGR